MEQLVSNCRDLRVEDPSTLAAKEKILRTAIILFNKHGVHTTGIDRIIAEADVAKMTFYKHYPSKTDLIIAYLQVKHDARFSQLKKHTTDKSADPFKQILGVFDALKEWFEESDFNGCPFVRGLTDFNLEKDPLIYAQVEAHFSQWSSFFKDRLTKILKPSKVETALMQLMTLVVGTVAMALATKSPKTASINKKLAECILETSMQKSAGK